MIVKVLARGQPDRVELIVTRLSSIEVWLIAVVVLSLTACAAILWRELGC